jgi:beta-lactamase class A
MTHRVPGRPLSDLLDAICTRFSGRVGYVFTNLDTGERLVHNEGMEFPTASTVKLPILTALHQHLQESGTPWDETIPVRRSEVAPGSGILQYLSRDLELSLRDLAWLMICLSDNTATNLVLDTIGRPRASEIIGRLIDPAIRLRGFAGAAVETSQPSMGYATPAALGGYLERLARRSLPGAADTVAVAGQQVFQSMLPRYLPQSPDAPVPLTIAHKTGALPGIRADIGLVSSAATTVGVAIQTADGKDLAFDTLNEGELCIGALTYAVCRDWLDVSSDAGDAALAQAG